MRISDWSSDLCSSDLAVGQVVFDLRGYAVVIGLAIIAIGRAVEIVAIDVDRLAGRRIDRNAVIGQVLGLEVVIAQGQPGRLLHTQTEDRKSTRLNSSH